MNRTIVVMLGSIVLFGGLIYSMRDTDEHRSVRTNDGTDSGESAKPLVLFCAASNRAVMEAVRKDYEEEFGIPINVQYGPSNTLLSTLEVTETGDLYLPADDGFLDIAREKKLSAEVIPIAGQQGVVAVPKGNPKGIDSFDDLLSDDLRVVQANPDGAAIAKMTRKLLTRNGLWDQLDKATAAYRTTVNDVANDIKVDAADAGIVFDAVLTTYPELEFVELPELEPVAAKIAIGILNSSKQPQRALHFARYLSAEDKGLVRYREFGFRTEKGDQWDNSPEVTIYAGSMLRPAIEETIREFEKREDVKVTRVYNGCGILVGQMKAGQQPDAYFACDAEFMTQVKDLFPTSVSVSTNELVILVQKGNPHGLKTLRDLTNEGLRVGIGHEKQCAMGWLTQQTLKEGGVQTEVMKNVTVQTPTGDMLVNQLKAGALDAAVAYLSNAAGSADVLDAVRIKGLQCAQATQPFAIAKNSTQKQIVSRLYQQILSQESQDRFIKEGFTWQPDAIQLPNAVAESPRKTSASANE